MTVAAQQDILPQTSEFVPKRDGDRRSFKQAIVMTGSKPKNRKLAKGTRTARACHIYAEKLSKPNISTLLPGGAQCQGLLRRKSNQVGNSQRVSTKIEAFTSFKSASKGDYLGGYILP